MPKVIYFKFIYLYELITKSNSMYKHLITQWCSDIIGLRKVIIAGLWYSINQSIIFILISHIQRYREDINIHITNTE
jgi:hypothetical protein